MPSNTCFLYVVAVNLAQELHRRLGALEQAYGMDGKSYVSSGFVTLILVARSCCSGLLSDKLSVLVSTYFYLFLRVFEAKIKIVETCRARRNVGPLRKYHEAGHFVRTSRN